MRKQPELADLRIALDQNFPTPIVAALRPFVPPGVTLTSVRDIDPRFEDAEDWQVILALSRLGFDLFATLDTSMLSLPLELLVIERTKFKVMAIEAAGHQPITASGILLGYLERLRADVVPGRPQVWSVPVRLPKALHPGKLLIRAAGHLNTPPALLRQANALSDAEWRASDPLSLPKKGPFK